MPTRVCRRCGYRVYDCEWTNCPLCGGGLERCRTI
jgi:ribosomal protein L37E